MLDRGSPRVMGVLKALIIAVSLALDVFAVSIGVGMRKLDRSERLRLGTAFVCAELSMTLVGAACGSVVERLVGPIAGYLGFAALVGIGVYMIIEAMNEHQTEFNPAKGFGLIVSALAISLDSLGIGFSLLFIGVPFLLTIGCIGLASIIATSAGFALGERLGATVGERVGIYAGILLALTGIVFAALKFTGHG